MAKIYKRKIGEINMARKDLMGNELSDNLTLEINYKGTEFESFVDISTLNKKLMAIDKTIKNSVDALKSTRKIKSQKDIIQSVKIDLKRNSIDNVILVEFVYPLSIQIIGGLFVGYLMKLSNKQNNKVFPVEHYSKEFEIMDKNVSHLNQIEKLINVKSINSNVEIKFENNNFNISNEENQVILDNIKELKKNLEFEEYEEEFIGKIEKLDLSKDNFHFTLDFTNKKVPLQFENGLELKEIKDIIGERIKIKAISRYKNKDLYDLNVLDYNIVQRKSLKDFK